MTNWREARGRTSSDDDDVLLGKGERDQFFYNFDGLGTEEEAERNFAQVRRR